jgi:hypothetical protein
VARGDYRTKQVAIRRLLLNTRGELNRDARALAVELRKLCGPSPSVSFSSITQYDRNGAVDPIGTAQAAARREIWDHFVKLLHLEPSEAANLREEEE